MTVLERAPRMGRCEAGADLRRSRAGNMYGSGVRAWSIIAQKRALPSMVGREGSGGFEEDWEGLEEALWLVEDVADVREVSVGAGASGGGNELESEGFAAEAVFEDDCAPLS
jgi:hypothetical protein